MRLFFINLCFKGFLHSDCCYIEFGVKKWPLAAPQLLGAAQSETFYFAVFSGHVFNHLLAIWSHSFPYALRKSHDKSLLCFELFNQDHVRAFGQKYKRKIVFPRVACATAVRVDGICINHQPLAWNSHIASLRWLGMGVTSTKGWSDCRLYYKAIGQYGNKQSFFYSQYFTKRKKILASAGAASHHGMASLLPWEHVCVPPYVMKCCTLTSQNTNVTSLMQRYSRKVKVPPSIKGAQINGN